MQPIISFSMQMLEHLSGRFSAVVRAMPEDALNWRPGDEATNSVAQIVRHVVVAENLILGVALGEQRVPVLDERSRGLHNDPATYAELLSLLEDMNLQVRQDLDRLDPLDLTSEVPGPTPGPAYPRFTWVAHSVGEAREHIGHAELTFQVWKHLHGEGPDASSPFERAIS